jgi:hypothetical protein
MKTDEIRAKMEKLTDFIREAEVIVRGGKMVDLSGLDRDVATICNKAVSLPPDQAREIQPLMAELIGSLEQLSGALVTYKEDLKG